MSQHPINNAYLRQFPEFLEFFHSSADENEGRTPEPTVTTSGAAETTPEELMDAGFRQIQKTSPRSCWSA